MLQCQSLPHDRPSTDDICKHWAFVHAVSRQAVEMLLNFTLGHSGNCHSTASVMARVFRGRKECTIYKRVKP